MNGQFNFGEVSPLRYFLYTSSIIGLLFAFIAPDDESYSRWTQIIQWQLQTVVPVMLACLIQVQLSSTPFMQKLNPWLSLSISGTFAATLFAPLAFQIDTIMGSQSVQTDWMRGALNEWSEICIPIALGWVGLNAPFLMGWQINRRDAMDSPNHELSEIDPNNGFLQKLPPEVRSNPIWIKSELHYLMVYTDRGKSLILATLADAISDLSAITSIQPHRSYWVNLDYVETLERRGREADLKLFDGTTIPVSRNRLKEVSTALEVIKRLE
ncbi:MAG: LytTR family DNA-binding domain-containing protein [Pseudomonadota bacterium]